MGERRKVISIVTIITYHKYCCILKDLVKRGKKKKKDLHNQTPRTYQFQRQVSWVFLTMSLVALAVLLTSSINPGWKTMVALHGIKWRRLKQWELQVAAVISPMKWGLFFFFSSSRSTYLLAFFFFYRQGTELQIQECRKVKMLLATLVKLVLLQENFKNKRGKICFVLKQSSLGMKPLLCLASWKLLVVT